MTINQAIQEVRDGLIDGVRGYGTAALEADAGNHYVLLEEGTSLVLCRFDEEGNCVERFSPASTFPGRIANIRWSCDQSGGLYC